MVLWNDKKYVVKKKMYPIASVTNYAKRTKRILSCEKKLKSIDKNAYRTYNNDTT